MSNPLRILYISHLHPPDGEHLKNVGGMQRVSMQLMSELQSRDDVELHPWILKSPWDGIERRTAGFIMKLGAFLPSKIRKTGADVVLFSSMVTATSAMMVRSRTDIPLVAITHGQDVTKPVGAYQWLVPKVFNRLDGVITVSEATKKACLQRGLSEKKVRALANGFDEEDKDIYPQHEPARRNIEKRFNLDLDGKYLLLTVGRLVERKGHERFVRNILPLIQAEVRYLIIGEGAQKKALEEAIRETGQENRVVVAGRQPDSVLLDAYAASDLFIMPNVPVEGDMEGFGIVLLEANLAETPAVASDLEGIKDVVKNGANGFRIEVGRDRKFANKIENLLQRSDLREKGREARKFVVSNFSWEHVAERYLEFIIEIVRRQQNP